jgi:hypothetical protein
MDANERKEEEEFLPPNAQNTQNGEEISWHDGDASKRPLMCRPRNIHLSTGGGSIKGALLHYLMRRKIGKESVVRPARPSQSQGLC